jgi:hypothetical protein
MRAMILGGNIDIDEVDEVINTMALVHRASYIAFYTYLMVDCMNIIIRSML